MLMIWHLHRYWSAPATLLRLRATNCNFMRHGGKWLAWPFAKLRPAGLGLLMVSITVRYGTDIYA